jgi:hypothetical protein
MKTAAPDYTEQELGDLCKYYWDHLTRTLDDDEDGDILHQYKWGHVASIAAAVLLELAPNTRDTESGGRFLRIQELKQIGEWVAHAINRNNFEAFDQLAKALRVRAKTGDFKSATRKQLGLPSRRGRGKTPQDLSVVFPMALYSAVFSRMGGRPDGVKRDCRRITRKELKDYVKRRGVTISESELSRWIARMKFGRFMAEQPIARKRAKKAE